MHQKIPDARLPRALLLAFALPAILQGFTHAPENLVQGIYAKETGIPLGAIAGALLLIRVFDGITYPLIGWASDVVFRRTGSRKAWVVAGTAVLVTGLWFLYRPPADVDIAWFTGWSLVAYLGWKLTEIPYSAWSIELSSDYEQRGRIQVWRGVGTLAGMMVFYAVPYAARALGLATGTQMTLQTLSLTAIVVVAVMPLLNLVAILRVPDGVVPVLAAGTKRVREPWASVAASVFRNGPLLILLAAFIPVVFLGGLSTGVAYLYFDAYLHLGERLPALMLTVLPISLLGLPVWGWFCNRWERHRVWAVSNAVGALAYASMAFVQPGPDCFALMLVLLPLSTFCVISYSITVPAMLGDCADYGRWRFHEDRAGLYSSLHLFILKSLGGVSAAAGFALVGVLGFDATATTQSAAGRFAIVLASVGLPALGLLAGAAIAWFFLIDRARQRAIQADLEARETSAR